MSSISKFSCEVGRSVGEPVEDIWVIIFLNVGLRKRGLVVNWAVDKLFLICNANCLATFCMKSYKNVY